MSWLKYIPIDKFLLSILTVVALATLLPAQGEAKEIFKHLTIAAIALLFFMHGAKLSRKALLSGLGHWRLHLCVFSSTFLLFPLIGLTLFPLLDLFFDAVMPGVFTPEIYMGFLFLCALPGTVQAAIAFTSMAGGNVPAAICSSSASSILGVFLSPLLVGVLMKTQGEAAGGLDAILAIVLQLMVPFLIGHFLRPWIGVWIDSHKKLICKVDQTSILLIVYSAFSEAVVEGIWSRVNGWTLTVVFVLSLLLLILVIVINTFVARRMKFTKADEITLVFCGSKKSLVNGVPMANVLFAASTVGIMILPLMIYHQIQLIACTILAKHYAKQTKTD